MAPNRKGPRILVVTPEVTCVRYHAGSGPRFLTARAGGLGDVCATQVHGLTVQGAEVHLALPNYRDLFQRHVHPMPRIDTRKHPEALPADRIHLAQDRCFYYHSRLSESTDWENLRISLSFQREVIHRIIPEVQPDLIHCYGWMTGLIPAMARRIGIPCIFTVYRCVSPQVPLSTIEEQGIDAASFWQHCYFRRMPVTYQETRKENPLDLLASGVFAARRVQVMSHSFLAAVMDAHNSMATPSATAAIAYKHRKKDVRVQPPVPWGAFSPKNDSALLRPYGPDTHRVAKAFNKLQLQETLNLRLDSTVPVCFWPTRLDGSRSGFRLMADVLPTILHRYRQQELQLVFMAEGDAQEHLMQRVRSLGAGQRVAVCSFHCLRYRLALGGADFVLMPLRCDPCALACRIGHRYGALPIAFDAGAIHDCVRHLVPDTDTGNGFLFRHFDATGFLWALDQAMGFYRQKGSDRARQVRRIMTEAMADLEPEQLARQSVNLYRGVCDGLPASDHAPLHAFVSSHFAA